MITEETIKKIALLARLELTPNEVVLYTKQLGHILDYVSELSKVKTEGTQPLVTPTDMTENMREDKTVATGDGSWAVSNAPDKSGNLFKVPPVL